MTATNPNQARARFRLSAMEVLGFIDTPGTASRPWQGAATMPTTGSTTPNPVPGETNDPFDDWAPQVAARLSTGRVRWGLMVAVLVLGGVVGAGAYWLSQRSQAESRAAMTELQNSAEALKPRIQEFQALNRTLTSPSMDAIQVNDVMLGLDASVRDLFAAGAVLSDTDTMKARTLEVASDLAGAQGMFVDAYAYRSTMIPVLAAPLLETDPGLVTLDQAAASFSDWQTGFETARRSLPTGFLPEVTATLDGLSSRLAVLQGEYLSGLADNDPSAAAAAITALEGSLSVAETRLFEVLAEVQTDLESVASDALAALAAVP